MGTEQHRRRVRALHRLASGGSLQAFTVHYSFQFGPVFDNWPLLLQGTWNTIELSFLAMLFGLMVAIVCAWGKTSGPRPLRWVINAYIELIRNTPFLVQLFFFYFGLPAAGVRWSAYTAALVAMVVNLGAYATEIVRAGIESIPKGQIEAGLALNLSRVEIFRFIILKPALRAIYPALTSQFILLMLASSVVSVISADDLTSIAVNLVSQTFRSFEIYIVVTVIYLLLTLIFSFLFRRLFLLGLDYPDRR
jgi:polar amino acid transport system permease protein